MRDSCLALLAVAVVACGDNIVPVIVDAQSPEGLPVRDDASIDAPPAPAMITLSGTAIERTIQGTMPVAGATIAAFASSNETNPLATTTTAANGTFSLTILTGGFALEGFMKASKTGFVDTYLYPAGFVDSDLAMIPLQMLTPGNYDALSTLTQGNQVPGKGLIALQILDAEPPAGMPVGGATVESNPAASSYHYNDTNGLPSSLATSTHTDGIAYMFNVAPNILVGVTATKAGLTFTSHGVKAVPDALTTTFIAP